MKTKHVKKTGTNGQEGKWENYQGGQRGKTARGGKRGKFPGGQRGQKIAQGGIAPFSPYLESAPVGLLLIIILFYVQKSE